MKLELKISVKTLTVIKKCLISVIIQLSQNTVMIQKLWIQKINRTQSKDHRIRTYEINKTLLSSFDDKIYIQKNGYDGLAFDN